MKNVQGKTRAESDSLGTVDVPVHSMWGAQTQRSLVNFAIGSDKFPMAFIHGLNNIKKAAAIVNHRLSLLDKERADLIQLACAEIESGKHDDQFPLSVWQTGSGTQTNMNVNEVLANIGNVHAGSELGEKAPLHPNDHVNLSQSSNDVFPTAMHIVTWHKVTTSLLPNLKKLQLELGRKAEESKTAVISVRTHMMDATPVTLGQEFDAFAAQVEFAIDNIANSLESCLALPIGGTAVGTGYNSHPRWAQLMASELGDIYSCDFRPAKNKFSQMASHDALRGVHGQISGLATALYKISSDIRLMNSGPRCGFSEITIPANEPGSSIMPGKVNPTQVEALTMVCLRVIGNDASIAMANSQGQFQLNTYKPLIIHQLLESITLLTDACVSFTDRCLIGIKANSDQLEAQSRHSLMLATALVPELGYDKTAKLVGIASTEGLSLKEAAIEAGYMTPEEFDLKINPAFMLGPSR